MNTVWSFGDSMTAPLNGLPKEPSPFRQWLGRDAKDTATFVAEEFGFESKNLALGGSSNTAIFLVEDINSIATGSKTIAHEFGHLMGWLHPNKDIQKIKEAEYGKHDLFRF